MWRDNFWHVGGKSWLEKIRSLRIQKRTPKPKNRTNNAKEFSEQYEGVTGYYHGCFVLIYRGVSAPG